MFMKAIILPEVKGRGKCLWRWSFYLRPGQVVMFMKVIILLEIRGRGKCLWRWSFYLRSEDVVNVYEGDHFTWDQSEVVNFHEMEVICLFVCLFVLFCFCLKSERGGLLSWSWSFYRRCSGCDLTKVARALRFEWRSLAKVPKPSRGAQPTGHDSMAQCSVQS